MKFILMGLLKRFRREYGREPSFSELTNMGKMAKEIENAEKVIPFPTERITDPFKPRPGDESSRLARELEELTNKNLKDRGLPELKLGQAPKTTKTKEPVDQKLIMQETEKETLARMRKENQDAIKRFKEKMDKRNRDPDDLSGGGLAGFAGNQMEMNDPMLADETGVMNLKRGGRIGFKKGGIDLARRAFVKLMGMTGAGLGALKLGLLGGKSKIATKTAESIIKNPAQGMPEWFPKLVEKVLDEGTDITKQAGEIERQIVKEVDLGSGEKITVFKNLDTDDVRVNFDSPANVAEENVMLEYRAGRVIEEGKARGKKTQPEFEAVEAEPRVVNMDGDIEFDGENLVTDLDELTSDTSKLKQYATGKNPTMKEIVKSKQKRDAADQLNKSQEAQIDYIDQRGGFRDPDPEDFIDDIDELKSGGLAGLLGE